MTQTQYGGFTWNLPYRGRFGYQIACTLAAILDASASERGIALYAAMGLQGKAKRYEDVYRRSFIRFAEANTDKLQPGAVGPKGGWGYRFRQPGEWHEGF